MTHKDGPRAKKVNLGQYLVFVVTGGVPGFLLQTMAKSLCKETIQHLKGVPTAGQIDTHKAPRGKFSH